MKHVNKICSFNYYLFAQFILIVWIFKGTSWQAKHSSLNFKESNPSTILFALVELLSLQTFIRYLEIENPHCNLPSVSVNSSALNRKIFRQLTESTIVLFYTSQIFLNVFKPRRWNRFIGHNCSTESTQSYRLHKFSTAVFIGLYRS